MGFGMTTVLLNLHNMGFFGINNIVVAMGIFYGGLAQMVAGAMEFRKGNTFGTLAFTSYGAFWLTLVFIIISGAELPLLAPDNAAWAAYLFLWGLFTLGMFFGTLKTNRALQTVFLSLAILFFLLTAAQAIPQLGQSLGSKESSAASAHSTYHSQKF
jgi:succinate-acetate transporter protein